LAESYAHQLTVVIPQYNAWHETISCCSSLWRHHGNQIQIIVVDDGSAPEEVAYARRYLGTKTRILSQEHQGVTAAWNLGLASVETPYAVLLNNDAMTIQPWAKAAVRALERHPARLLGAERRREKMIERGHLKRASASDMLLAGWLLGFRMELFRQLGPFDESMALYWSDTDWQLRWRLNVGEAEPFSLLPRGVLRHRGHQSTRLLRERSAMWRRDRERFLAKWDSSP